MIRVAVYDDNAYRCESLSVLINWTEGFSCVGTFPDCTSALEDIRQCSPDVVLMDINMPGISGIEGTEIIKKAFPQIAILIQTVFDDNEKVFASICAGASGYILKKSTPAQIIDAIRDIYEGGASMTSSIAKQVLLAFQQQKIFQIPANFNLSDREKEILNALVKGLSYKMIAAECNISFHTVNSHVKKIYEKLHVNSVAEAVAKAIREKIV